MLLPGYIIWLVVLINSHLNVLERREELFVSQRWLSTPYYQWRRSETHNAYKEKEKNVSKIKKRNFLIYEQQPHPLGFDEKLFLVSNNVGRTADIKYADLKIQTISSFDVIFFCSNQAYIWDSSSFPDLWSWGFGPLVSGEINGGWAMLSNLQNWAFREVLKYTPVRLIFHITRYPLSVIFASLRLFSFWLQKCFPTGWSSEVRFTGIRARGWSPSHKCGF